MGRSNRQPLQAEVDRAHTEIALLKEDLSIKGDRWSWSAFGYDDCASRQTAIRGTRGPGFSLVVGPVEGRRRLPVIELRRAAWR